MTRQERKHINKLLEGITAQFKILNDMINLDSTETNVVKTNLDNRNFDVFICRTYLYMNYDQIANALNISRAQVGESLKVLRDKGLIKSKRKATVVSKNMAAVKRLTNKNYSRNRIAKELGISDKTVVRCQQRLCQQ